MTEEVEKLWAHLTKEVTDADSVGYQKYSFWVSLRPNWDVINTVIDRFAELGFKVSRRPEFIDLDWEHKYGFYAQRSSRR